MSEDINQDLVNQFRILHYTMRQKGEGRSSQKRIMIVLYKHGGVMRQNDLTKHLQIQSGSVSEILAKLEKAELIVRTPNAMDKRTADVILTKTGRKEAQEILSKRQNRQSHLFDPLDEQEKKELLRLLEKLNQNLSK